MMMINDGTCAPDLRGKPYSRGTLLALGGGACGDICTQSTQGYPTGVPPLDERMRRLKTQVEGEERIRATDH